MLKDALPTASPPSKHLSAIPRQKIWPSSMMPRGIVLVSEIKTTQALMIHSTPTLTSVPLTPPTLIYIPLSAPNPEAIHDMLTTKTFVSVESTTKSITSSIMLACPRARNHISSPTMVHLVPMSPMFHA